MNGLPIGIPNSCTTFTILNIYSTTLHTDSIKINSPGHNISMYCTSFWQPTVHVQQNVFEKSLVENCSPHLYAFFWHFLRSNWSIIRGTVSIWTFEGIPKSTTFPFDDSDLSISKHTLKTHCVSNNWPIWAQKVSKEA